MDPDEVPPPPYSAVDPLLAQANRSRDAASSTAIPTTLHLRGGNAPLLASSAGAATASGVLPLHFSSGAAYFAERPAPVIEPGEQTLEHHVTIYPRSQAKDFPRRPRCWNPRLANIAQPDWDMFLRHLFPPHLGLASSSAELPRQVRAEIRRDRKDRPQETDEERERRIATVILEWNQYFFEPRAVRIVFFYVTDPRTAPASPLCPKCYPAATRVSQENRSAQTSEAGRGQPLPANMYPAATAYPQQPGYPGQVPSPYGYPNPVGNPAPFLSPQTASGFFHPANPHVYQNSYQQYQPWGWGNQQYAQQYETSKGGPLGWFSNLAAQAQKYGERISEQAQQYGDQISAHASHYGRQVEEQAMAHGRWIEEQAGLGSRKVEGAFSGWNTPQQPGYYPYYYAQPTTPDPSQQTAQTQQPQQPQSQAQTETQTQPQSQPRSQTQPEQQPRSRRDSTCSASSDSSLSSIDSISTTSELSSSDLATVRAQLLSLDDYHDRDLYDAAVELRRQLDAIRESRRQARMHSRTGRWRHGWGSSHSQSRNDGQGRSSWGRWESPQDRQRNQAERRAAKEELRATRKAFREVLRRARDEQKEQRKVKRNRRRQERRARWGQTNQREDQAAAAAPPATAPQAMAAPDSPTLEQRLQNLELGNDRGAPTQQGAARAGSESSAAISINTPSISSEEENDMSRDSARTTAKKALDKESK
ncbi:hypothetical protein BJY01DRAFT_222336 [Aspergillus pseudoustus]|uniref:Uncharacterized protein n=1 Tax=Aspergillus pseudoustus TaxID=1810923 RepID=A0ABR4JAU1_9EURO